MRYAGTTSSTQINGAIVVQGNSTSCGVPGFGAVAAAQILYSTFGNNYIGAKITAYKKNGPCDVLTWVNVPFTPPPNRVDLVGVMVHELGHAVYNMGHPYDPGYIGQECDYPAGLVSDSVMQGSSSASPLIRDLSNWDLEIAQHRFGVRAQFSRVYRSVYSGTSWGPSSPSAAGAGATPLFRMGSMPSAEIVRRLSWVDNGPGGATLRDGGAGWYYSAANYYAGTLNNWAYVWPSLGRPVASASQPAAIGSQEWIIAYQKPVGSNIYGSSHGSIHWRRSANGGTTWGAEDQNGNTTKIYGLTAAYDAFTKAFLIAFVVRDSTFYNRIHVTVVPAAGSTIPTKYTTALPYTALHAPSISCTGAVDRCLLAYEAPDGAGSLTGVFIGVNASTGQVHPVSAYQWSVPMFDTPGVAYNPSDDTFHFAVNSGPGVMSAYSMSNANPAGSMVSTGAVWNSNFSPVSTPVVTVRSTPSWNRPEIWFLRYWQ